MPRLNFVLTSTCDRSRPLPAGRRHSRWVAAASLHYIGSVCSVGSNRRPRSMLPLLLPRPALHRPMDGAVSTAQPPYRQLIA